MLLRTLEDACNRMLCDDPEAQHELGAIEDKIVALHLGGHAPVHVQIIGGRLYLHHAAPEAEAEAVITKAKAVSNGTEAVSNGTEAASDMPPAAVVRTTPGVLLETLCAATGPEAFSTKDIEISGDVEVVRHLAAALARCRDWEEQLATLLGDAPARKVGWVGRTLAALLREARGNALADLGWYLKDDAGLVARREEVTAFGQDVDALRDASRALEARVQRLEQAHQERGGRP